MTFGIDVFAEPIDSDGGACLIYCDTSGGITRAPSIEQFRAAIEVASRRSSGEDDQAVGDQQR